MATQIVENYRALKRDNDIEGLLERTMTRKNYFFNKIPRYRQWAGNPITINFEEAPPTSVTIGGFTSATDIDELDIERGRLKSTDFNEVTGTLFFREKDLRLNSADPKKFFNLYGRSQKGMINHMSRLLNYMIYNGGKIANISVTPTNATAATRTLDVDRVDRFWKGMKVTLVVVGTEANNTELYVTAVDKQNKRIQVAGTRNGTSLPDSLTASTNAKWKTATATAGKIYNATANPTKTVAEFDKDSILDMRKQLKAPGTSTNTAITQIAGLNKSAYSFLQAVEIPAATSGIGDQSSDHILRIIFKSLAEWATREECKAKDVLLGPKQWASVMNILETKKGAYKVMPREKSTVQYGWDEVRIMGLDRMVNFVKVLEKDDDQIEIIDPMSFKLYCHRGIIPTYELGGVGIERIRATTGISYIEDYVFGGNMLCLRPHRNMSITGITSSILARTE